MMTVEQDGPRVAEYLIVAGLSETSRPLDEGLPNDSHLKASSTPSEPITDVAVILRGHGEKVPAGFTCIETTPTGFPADLSHGCIGSPNIFLCIKRGFDKPPLTDIGILYEGKERVMNGCEIISTTPTGHPANVNNSRIGVGGQRAYITYRRAQSTSPQNSLAVYDICVILANKGESPPHAFCKINKNLNKGAVVGSDVYMCYKKSAIKSDSVTFQPETLSRYPLEDHESFTLPDSVSRFCLPMGAVIECWSRERMHPLPVFSTFILTDSTGDKIYGAAVTFYETYPEESLTPQQKIALNIKQKKEDGYNIHTNKAVCLLSRWPFFEPFKKFLSFLYRLSISGPHVIPIERYIAHFIHEVPFPTTQRPRILVPLAHDKLILTQPRMTAIPLSGASFCALLRNLGPDNCMNLLVYALLEHKILLHSLRPALLTSVSEAVSKVIFPFVWQCPYIPLCPLTLCGVLCAPLPFIVGVDSRYFDSYEAPSDVTCIDIDTNSLLQCDDRKGQNWKILPKKPAKRLHAKLDSLYVELCQSNVWDGISDDLAVEIAPLDNDFSRKKKQAHMELCIQEAFLVFMASMLKGYQQYLLPITQQPNMRTMDATSRFDGPGFIKSRDKMSHAFFKQFIKTQMFMFFIEERSFVSHNDDIFNFFDECTRKVDSESREELKFLETEDSSQSSEHTVYVAPPEPVGNEDQKGYSYNVFPRLNDKYFNTSTATPLKRGRSTKSIPTSPVPRRTKQEIKSSLELAKKQASSPEEWAKCLMGNCYSIWFTHLPSYVKSSHSKTRALRTAFTVLKKMQAYNLTLADEVCYRVIMQLCGQYCQPVLAVQVFMEMKKNGITLNASTYGYYNKAVLESPWPTSSFTAYQQWIKLRNVIMAVAQFRQGLKRSNWDTVSETDTRSGSSVDVDIVIGDAKPEIQLIDIAGNLTREEKCGTGNSDMGYASMIESLGSTDLLGSPDATIVPVQMSSPASPSRSPHLMDKSPLEEDTTQTLSSSAGLLITGHDSIDTTLEDSVFESQDPPKSNSTAFRKRHLSTGDSSHQSPTPCNYRSRTTSGDSNATITSYLTSQHSLDGESNIIRSNLFGSDAKILEGFAHSNPKLRLSPLLGNNNVLNEGENVENMDEKFLVQRSHSVGSKPDNWNELMFDEVKGTPEQKMEIESLIHGIEALSMNLHTTKVNDEKIAESKDNENALICLMDDDIPGNSILDQSIEFEPQLIDFSSERTPNSTVVSSENDLLVEFTETNTSSNTVIEKSDLEINLLDETQGTDLDTKEETADEETTNKMAVETETVPNGHIESVERTEHKTIFHGSSSLMSLNEQHEGDSQSSDSYSGSKENLSLAKKTPRRTNSFFSRVSNFSPRVTKLNLTKTLSNASEQFETLHGSAKKVAKAARAAATRYSTKVVEYSRQFSIPLMDQQAASLTDIDKHSLSDTYLNRPTSWNEFQFDGIQDDFGTPLTGSMQSLNLSHDMEDFASRRNLAMDIRITSCNRCYQCNAMLYDEVIMAGWSADESNLNTKCFFCSSPNIVPFLFINIEDLRGKSDSCGALKRDNSAESMHSLQENTKSLDTHQKKAPSVPSIDNLLLEKFDEETNIEDSDSEKLINLDDDNLDTSRSDSALTVEVDKSLTQRQRSTSECKQADLVDMGQSLSSLKPFEDRNRRQLKSSTLPARTKNLTVQDEFFQASSLTSSHYGSKEYIPPPANKKKIEPISVPYLSPLVLRKEMENAIEHEGESCLRSPEFVEMHPIIFWNLIWYFRRLEIPTNLPGLILAAYSEGRETVEACNQYLHNDSRHIKLNLLWDNVELYNEIGVPMYILWNNRNSSLMKALITERQSFSKGFMLEVVKCIKSNDVQRPIEMMLEEFKKQQISKDKRRSIYREILFLAFVALKRENIDHDAFDVEYQIACSRLAAELKEDLQVHDKSPAVSIQRCRKIFGELFL
ncbi:DENN domain-containing protein 4B-like isoform X2 [Anneissia japonica]|uniref:DENN domain-containing protein 4B-like isoform X2 n=1 Tax=Anneissia japonica TaxID=1529436 RepID=UPI0014257F7C|nr:DENN domain-containing protein 4B-like isoform X2 [Anneissia japonica]